MSDMSASPMVEFSPRSVKELGYVPSSLAPIGFDEVYAKTSAQGSTNGLPRPPIGVVLSFLYVAALVGAGTYFLLYFLLS